MFPFLEMAGQGNTSFKTCHTINKRGAAAIVTRLEARALTGENLNVAIHQHQAYDVHVTWTVKFKNPDEPPVDRCFERCFDAPEEYDAFREEVRQHPIQGTCSCVDNVLKTTLRKLTQAKEVTALSHVSNTYSSFRSVRVETDDDGVRGHHYMTISSIIL